MLEKPHDHYKKGVKRIKVPNPKTEKPILRAFDRFSARASDIRDHVITGAFVTAAAITFVEEEGKIQKQNYEIRAERIAADKLAMFEEELRQERKRSIREFAPDFHDQIAEKKDKRTPDMKQVWLNGFSPDTMLGGVSKYEYLRFRYLKDPSSLPNEAAATLRTLIPSLVATESRFDTNAVSHTNAFGAVQAVPGTFKDWHKFGIEKEIPAGKYEEFRSAFIKDFSLQVEFLNWYFPYMYDRLFADPGCAEELNKIKEQYFSNDEKSFNRYFIAPLLLNAYNAGFGTMKEVIEGVSGKVRSFRKTHPHLIPNQKYLAFFLATEDSELRNPNNADTDGRYFDKEKHEYVREIFAFDELMGEMIKRNGPNFELASNVRENLN